MKLEEHFKETLERAVAHEPPIIDAWTTFEHRVRRDRRAKVVGSMFAIAALIVAAVLVVPKLGGKPVGFDNPGPTPESPTPSIDPYGNWTTYSGIPDHGGYTLRYPQEWRVLGFEGSNEVVPPGHGGTAAGLPTMAVTVELLNEEFDDLSLYRDKGFDRSTRADGRPYVWRESLLADGARRYEYRFDWSECVPSLSEQGCTRDPRTLVVEIHAGTGELWGTYGAIAERIVGSIEWGGIYVGEPPRTNKQMIPSSSSN